MEPWMPLDLGHSTPTLKQLGLPGDRLEHAHCNRSYGDGPTIIKPTNHTPSRNW